MVKTKLSVNINKLATLRNARGGENPNVIQWAQKIEDFGAHGITVHPRPDERHIRKLDVVELKKTVRTEFNIEGYPSPDFCAMVCDIKPTQVTLVPDEPGQLTSDHGWNTRKHTPFLKEIIAQFKSLGIRTSIFLDPDAHMVPSAAETGTDRIELYTESYAQAFKNGEHDEVIEHFQDTAKACNAFGIGLNAGHDLDLNNLGYFVKHVTPILEVSIGHALICDALEFGMESTVKQYLNILE